jgi:hypothetical protein
VIGRFFLLSAYKVTYGQSPNCPGQRFSTAGFAFCRPVFIAVRLFGRRVLGQLRARYLRQWEKEGGRFLQIAYRDRQGTAYAFEWRKPS